MLRSDSSESCKRSTLFFPMLSTAFILFVAGLLTVLLPCILPLIPIVLGISIAGRSKWRPLLTIAGMVVSFVGFTFLLQVVLMQFVEVADYIRIATYYLLLLFGIGFFTHNRIVQCVVAALGGLFFINKGWVAVMVAAVMGIIAMEVGGRIATKIQQLGGDIQAKTRTEFGADTPITAFIIGLTLGLVWVPCAGPALGFALTLVRDQPGFEALLLLTAYAAGTAVPLLIVGYGGQWAVHSVRALSRFSGIIKQVAGALLILSALAFHFDLFTSLQTWFVENTGYGTLGTEIEEKLFQRQQKPPSSASSVTGNAASILPDYGPAPELVGLGPWYNSEPLTMAGLRGKVVLVDFWTYSCINCIRTMPYLRGYWDKYKDSPFVILGVHSPEFAFEAVAKNVEAAVKKYQLTYPIAQDNNFHTWRAFANQYWPAKYLIDAEGNIRYAHFGEGAYEETDRAIALLLAEIGVEMNSQLPMDNSQSAGSFRDQTAETYLGERSWNALGNKQGDPSEQIVTYKAPESMKLNSYYLVGDWQLVDGERQVLRSDSGEIRIKFLGSEVNLVMGSEDTERIEADVSVDGGRPRPFRLTGYDLYPLFNGEYGEHELILRIRGKGAEAYAFTFGS